MFVVLEGGEGSGKSTQCGRLVERLAASGRDVVATFEPGATALGAHVRTLLLHHHDPIDPQAELFLLLADRADHLASVVRPALARGAVVVCDRFVPSTLAYQGVGRDLGVERVEALCGQATGGLEPDLVVVLDVTDEVAAQRRPVSTDRVEAAGAAFHRQVRAAYRDLAAERAWVVIDGAGSPEEVAERVWAAVAPLVGLA